ncbi:zf-HC2 domain-containing protein [Stigmatella aurantiaca]|uniref:Conserved uncharacterized protein n=1 Tax=Stigmatella aurantiaca (strain DW4/3-1) TaxID=378806 RepID=Q08YM7_STIAD|nr:zf-HC2 domain-containing protein [Stigmatella aurantiaca]ADO73212.1 conserved uncharacterized protein [Stigmatella aurantiaca DW4/3-1]EAU65600.1 hypothetical protein STIAU_7516 [Stigmatella aurantiaca DW4/3-1]
MKPQNLHAPEDRLLDFAYGELSAKEALAVESHLEGCPRCREALASIRGVRSAFSQLSLEPAPEAGLESLLAYAQQSARGMAAGPAPKQTLWRRLTVPVMGVAAVCVFGMVTLRVTEKVHLQPEFSAKAQEAQTAAMAPEPIPSAEPALPSTPAEFDTLSPAKPQMPQLSKVRREPQGNFAEKKKEAPARSSQGKAEAPTASKSKGGRYQEEVDGKASSLADDLLSPLPPPSPVAAAPAPAPAAEEVAGKVALARDLARRDMQDKDTAGYGSVSDEAERAKEDGNAAPPSSSLRLGESQTRQRKPVASGGAGPAAKRPVSETELSQQAIVARQDDKRVLEVSLLREALAAGATGEERLSLLTRLCDAEFALGRREAAIEACSRVLKEAPGSQAAQVARRRLLQDSPAKAAPAQPGSQPASPPAQAP